MLGQMAGVTTERGRVSDPPQEEGEKRDAVGDGSGTRFSSGARTQNPDGG